MSKKNILIISALLLVVIAAAQAQKAADYILGVNQEA